LVVTIGGELLLVEGRDVTQYPKCIGQPLHPSTQQRIPKDVNNVKLEKPYSNIEGIKESDSLICCLF
jgi:hypothetical protein